MDGKTRAPSRLLPDTTLGQILAILLGALLLTFGVIVLLLFALRPSDTDLMRGPHSNALQAAMLVQALQASAPADRPAIAATLHMPLTRADPACATARLHIGGREFAHALDHLLSPDLPLTLQHCPSAAASAEEHLQVTLPTLHAVFDVTIADRPARAGLIHMWMPLIGALVFLFILVAVLSAWAIGRVIRPLHRLSQAVDTFGRDVEPALLAPALLVEEGPREIRRAARAINQMQQRIAAAMADRTRMLAAISHDLRTPITRLRLRTELEATGEARVKTLRDIDLMRRLVDGALSYLRGAPGSADTEPFERIDLTALLQTLCDEAAETGADVTWHPAPPILCRCRPNALARAVTNLIQNACHYGIRARLAATQTRTAIRIDIADDGPGIPAALWETALRPFARLSPARSAGEGVGLGLAIVADIVRDHAGQLHLGHTGQGGLLVTIELPHDPPTAQSPPDPRSSVR